MLNRLLILLIGIAFIGCGADDIKNDLMVSCSNWKNNDSLLYDVVITEYKVTTDTTVYGTKSSYRASLTLSQVNDKNTITWSIKKPIKRQDSITKLIDLVSSDSLDYIEMLQVVYQTNSQGQYESIVNWKEIENFTDSVWNDEFRGIKNGSTFDEKRYNMAKSVFLNRNAIEGKLARDIMALHYVYGDYDSDNQDEYETIAIGLSGKPTNTQFSYKFLEKNDENLIIQLTNNFDSKQIGNQLNDVVNQLTDSNLNSPVNIHDTCMVDFNTKTHWANQVEYWRTISIGDKKKRICVSLMQVTY